MANLDVRASDNTVMYLRQAFMNIAPSVTVTGNRANFRVRDKRFSMSLTPRTTRSIS